MEHEWGEQNKYDTWRVVCAVFAKVQAIEGLVPDILCEAIHNVERYGCPAIDSIQQYETLAKHDVVGFLCWLESKLHPDQQAWIHRGLTSSDIVDTANSLIMKEAYKLVKEAYCNVSSELRILGVKYDSYSRVARTHGVPAESSTWQRLFDSHFAELSRTMTQLRQTVNNLPGKCQGTTGKFISARVEQIAMDSLGLKTAHCPTQCVPRDYYTDVIYALTSMACAAERLATNMRMSVALGDITLEKTGVGSSAMPHKVNPVEFERVVGLSRVVRAQLQIALENSALWLDRDLTHSSADRIVFKTAFAATETLLISLLRGLQSIKNVFQRDPVFMPDSAERLFYSAVTGDAWSERHHKIAAGEEV
jgi:adenylosuccinate lyase